MEPILSLLAAGDYVSGEKISASLGVTRAAVWKRIRALQEAGWPIESGGKRGYRLGAHDRLEPETWQPLLRTRVIGRSPAHYETVLSSTNTVLKQISLESAADGTVCLCEQQTAGRGRLDRVWESPPGVGLWVSVLLKDPGIQPSHAHTLTFCGALAMSDAVEACCGFAPGIKWPNDLVYRGKKICGILLEASTQMDRINKVVIGTGLNVKPGAVPEALRAQAGCTEEFGRPCPRREILAAYLEALERWTDRLRAEGSAAVVRAVSERCVTLGQRVSVTGVDRQFSGLAVSLDESGVLMVRDEDGAERMVLAGDVSIRGLNGYA